MANKEGIPSVLLYYRLYIKKPSVQIRAKITKVLELTILILRNQ